MKKIINYVCCLSFAFILHPLPVSAVAGWGSNLEPSAESTGSSRLSGIPDSTIGGHAAGQPGVQVGQPLESPGAASPAEARPAGDGADQVPGASTENTMAEALAREISQEIAENQWRWADPAGKDVVVVLGNTGAGKSTLLNMFAGRSLVAMSDEELVLSNPDDASALVMGYEGDSQTRYPQSIFINDTLFYDLPGFQDTAGSTRELINTALIQRVLQGADRLRLFFVAAREELRSTRGAFKKMLDSLANLFRETSFDNLVASSVFVITKNQLPISKPPLERGAEPLFESHFSALLRAVDDRHQNQLQGWRHSRHLFFTQKPETLGEFSDPEYSSILDAIMSLQRGSLRPVNTRVFYSDATKAVTAKVFKGAMLSTLNGKAAELETASTFADLESLHHRLSKATFWEDFERNLILRPEIKLLCGLDSDCFTNTLTEFRNNNTGFLDALLSNLNSKKQKLENQVRRDIERLAEEAREAYLEGQRSSLGLAEDAGHYTLQRVQDRLKNLSAEGYTEERLLAALKEQVKSAVAGAQILDESAKQTIFDDTLAEVMDKDGKREAERFCDEIKSRQELLSERLKTLQAEFKDKVREVGLAAVNQYIQDASQKLGLDKDVDGYNLQQHVEVHLNKLTAPEYTEERLVAALQEQVRSAVKDAGLLDDPAKQVLFSNMLESVPEDVQKTFSSWFLEKIADYQIRISGRMQFLKERAAKEEAQRKEVAERQAKHDTERRAEADRRAKEEAERRAEVDRRAREEANRRAEEEARRREDDQRQAREAAEERAAEANRRANESSCSFM